MARMLRPAAAARVLEPDTRPGVGLEAGDDRASSVRLRIAPLREAPSFLEWAREQVEHGETPTSPAIQALEEKLIDALRAHDSAQALTVASVLVYECPDHAVARHIKARCAAQLRGLTRAFPRHDAIPRMRLAWHELEERNLSHRAAFMLSCIDGFSTVEQLMDISAMPPLVAYDTLDILVRDGIVELT